MLFPRAPSLKTHYYISTISRQPPTTSAPLAAIWFANSALGFNGRKERRNVLFIA
ncbi:hypothetical protein GCWU000325_01376 [Alloprevotella tannerae ATCC 51259]|uniref:Uncharacterized protein n=1 Tax=Alloprevotella tannerae ATCC 51259 TaxID=626522 RepID=C9LGN2_9BACT|nr:hypothetical protein GCWU000325_01376 [Alloprevotella tannerae ATCC 51259]